MATYAQKAREAVSYTQPVRGYEGGGGGGGGGHRGDYKNWQRRNGDQNFQSPGYQRHRNNWGRNPVGNDSNYQRDSSKPLWSTSKAKGNEKVTPSRPEIVGVGVSANKWPPEAGVVKTGGPPALQILEASERPSRGANDTADWLSAGFYQTNEWPAWDDPVRNTECSLWDQPPLVELNRDTEWPSWNEPEKPANLNPESFKSCTWTEPLPLVKEGVPVSQLTEQNLRTLATEVGEKVVDYEITLKRHQYKILDWVLHHTEEKPPNLEAIRRRAVNEYAAVRSFWKPFL